MYPACGRPRVNGFQNRSSFTKTRRNPSANSISVMLAAMLFIETAAMGHLRTREGRLQLRWGGGHGHLISGTSTMTDTPTSTSQMDISPAANETILPVSSGGRWSPNPLRTQHQRPLTSADG